MKILWHSNSPTTPSGYGTQTALFGRLLAQAGHEVIVSAFYGHRDATLHLGELTVLPGGREAWGNDVLPTHAQFFRPDAVVALVDVWVLWESVLRQVPLAAWAPVDHDPIPPQVAERLRFAAQPWAMSRFAEAQMRAVGLNPVYVPHGVDADVFQPIDRAAARQTWGIDEGVFLAVCVAANKGWPSRKSLDRLLKAWARFVETRPDALLYLHADAAGHDGTDLVDMARFYGVPDAQIRFPDPYQFLRGNYPPAALNALYNAADVLALPSAGGGFEIPLIEAQAAGCPVLSTRITAMDELIGPGYGIEVDPFDGLAYTLQHSEQANVLPSQILAGLEWAYERRGDDRLRAECRDFAMDYDGRRVLRDFMLPALERMAEDTAARRANGEQREAERAARTAQRQGLRRFPQQEAI